MLLRSTGRIRARPLLGQPSADFSAPPCATLSGIQAFSSVSRLKPSRSIKKKNQTHPNPNHSSKVMFINSFSPNISFCYLCYFIFQPLINKLNREEPAVFHKTVLSRMNCLDWHPKKNDSFGGDTRTQHQTPILMTGFFIIFKTQSLKTNLYLLPVSFAFLPFLHRPCPSPCHQVHSLP